MAIPRRLKFELAPELAATRLTLLPGGRRDPRRWMYVGEAARDVGVSRGDILDLIERGQLEAEPVAGHPRVWRIRTSAVRRLKLR